MENVLNLIWILCLLTNAAYNEVNSRSYSSVVVQRGDGFDAELRTAISDCFAPWDVDDDESNANVTEGYDVRLTPSDWWPPAPLTLNMIQVMGTLCRSHKLRASTNHCISEIYSSAQENDLQINMALAQLPLAESWDKAQEHLCAHSALSRDLPCVAHLQSSLAHCTSDHLVRSAILNRQRFLVCRQVDAAEICQSEVYHICSRHTAETLAEITRMLTPALCPPRQEAPSTGNCLGVSPPVVYFVAAWLVMSGIEYSVMFL